MKYIVDASEMRKQHNVPRQVGKLLGFAVVFVKLLKKSHV